MKSFRELLESSENFEIGAKHHNDYSWGYTGPHKEKVKSIHDKVSVPENELKSLDYYGGQGHININHHLRNDIEDLRTQGFSKNLNSLISKHITEHPIHVWRGVDSNKLNLNNMKSGDVFHDKGFVSTSLNPNVAKGLISNLKETKHLMHIEVPKGSKAVSRSLYFPHSSEDEVLLPSGSKFRYNGQTIDKDNDYIIHHLTHLP